MMMMNDDENKEKLKRLVTTSPPIPGEYSVTRNFILLSHHVTQRLDDMARKLEDLKMSVDSIEVRLGKNPFTRDHFRKEADDGDDD